MLLAESIPLHNGAKIQPCWLTQVATGTSLMGRQQISRPLFHQTIWVLIREIGSFAVVTSRPYPKQQPPVRQHGSKIMLNKNY